MGFSRQEHWSGLPCTPPGDLLDPGIEPLSPASGFVTHLGSPSLTAAAVAKSLQSCPTLCDPREGSPPGFPVPGILQARTLEWVAIPFSNAWKWSESEDAQSYLTLNDPMDCSLPTSMGFSRQEYRSGVPLPSPSQVLLHSSKYAYSALEDPMEAHFQFIINKIGIYYEVINKEVLSF